MGAARSDAVHQRDAQLVQRHRSGDLTAFAELYELHHERLLRYVRRQVRESHVAEDLTHDTFAAALAGITNLREPSRFYPWLVGIARVVVVRHYRAAGRTSQVADVAFVDDAPELSLLRQVDHDNIAVALGRVGDRYREVLRLHEHEELSYGDIAERLGLSPSIVKVLMHRARRALRREYLAVTEPERTAAVVPLLYGAAAGLRRLRDRLMPLASALPDSAAVTASMAAAAIGLASLFSPHPSAVEKRENAAVNVLAPIQSQLSSPGNSQQPPQPAGAAPTSAMTRPSSDVLSVTRYHPDVAVDEQEMRRRRSDSSHMPYAMEIGPTWIGVDPGQMQRDLQSSLAGDYGWMEG